MNINNPDHSFSFDFTSLSLLVIHEWNRSLGHREDVTARCEIRESKEQGTDSMICHHSSWVIYVTQKCGQGRDFFYPRSKSRRPEHLILIRYSRSGFLGCTNFKGLTCAGASRITRNKYAICLMGAHRK